MSDKTKVYTSQLKRMADTITCPEDLLKKVKKKYPDTIPSTTNGPHSLDRLIGQQDVIRFMEGIINMINKS